MKTLDKNAATMHLYKEMADSSGECPVALFDSGRAVFERIIELTKCAQERIYMRAFVWRDDEIGNRLGQALLDAANRGVSIDIEKDRIAAVYEYTGGTKQSFFHKKVHWTQGVQAWVLSSVYKSKGSFRQESNTLSEALLAHPNIRIRHQQNRFDHSKLFIFDDEYII